MSSFSEIKTLLDDFFEKGIMLNIKATEDGKFLLYQVKEEFIFESTPSTSENMMNQIKEFLKEWKP